MTREQFIKKKLTESNNYKEGYVAFLDLIGFSNLCLDKSCEEIKAIIDDIILMKYDYIFSFSKLIIPTEIINNTVVRLVSDSIIIVAPNNDYGLLFVLYFSALLHIKLLNCGILLRGGIEKGNYFVNEDTIFGPSIISAYKLESQKAIYPRTIISEDIINELKNKGFQKKKTVDDYLKGQNEQEDLSSQFELLCIKDADNCYFVHYFNTVQNIAFSKNTGHKEHLKSFINGSLSTYKDSEYYKKYEWLSKYYEKYIEEDFLQSLKNKLLSLSTEEKKAVEDAK